MTSIHDDIIILIYSAQYSIFIYLHKWSYYIEPLDGLAYFLVNRNCINGMTMAGCRHGGTGI